LPDLEHLSEEARAVSELDDDRRIAHLAEDHWIDYPRAREALQMLERLLRCPKRTRMPGLLLHGESNIGKSMIIQKFLRAHPAKEFNVDTGLLQVDVLAVEMPPGPQERRLYGQLLMALNAPYRPRHHGSHQQAVVPSRRGRHPSEEGMHHAGIAAVRHRRARVGDAELAHVASGLAVRAGARPRRVAGRVAAARGANLRSGIERVSDSDRRKAARWQPITTLVHPEPLLPEFRRPRSRVEDFARRAHGNGARCVPCSPPARARLLPALPRGSRGRQATRHMVPPLVTSAVRYLRDSRRVAHSHLVSRSDSNSACRRVRRPTLASPLCRGPSPAADDRRRGGVLASAPLLRLDGRTTTVGLHRAFRTARHRRIDCGDHDLPRGTLQRRFARPAR
jgi:hypothetical protein